jgi:hypothetical protein
LTQDAVIPNAMIDTMMAENTTKTSPPLISPFALSVLPYLRLRACQRLAQAEGN